MTTFNPEDKNVDVEEIEQLMDAYDNKEVFSTRFHYRKNYYAHYIKLISNGHVMTFRENYKNNLRGFGTWILVDKKTKHDINKVRWLLPNEINKGNILYIDTCLTTSKTMVHIMRKSLTLRLKGKVNEIFWFNTTKSRFVRKKVKGERLCSIVD